ncbi:MAG: hypothetical protein QM528_02530 [Phycisphaerales bacterium]|nr:hypothetical protein [Phycisphaerales bacterium]
MNSLKNQIDPKLSNVIEPCNLLKLKNMTEEKDADGQITKPGNLYKAIVIVTKRANKINEKIKDELDKGLEDFKSSADNLEDLHENRERIEYSMTYEKLPPPSILALDEYFKNRLIVNVRDERHLKD